MIVTGLEPTTTSIINKHSTIWPNWLNDWAALQVLTCSVHLTVCSYHVTCACQSESTCACQSESTLLVAWMSRNSLVETATIWSLSDSNPQPLSLWTNTQQFTKLAKWLSWIVSTICKVRLTIYSYRVTRVTHFRVNPRSIIGWMSRNSLVETATISEV